MHVALHLLLVDLELPLKSWSECSEFTNLNLPAESKNAPRLIIRKVFAHRSHRLCSVRFHGNQSHSATMGGSDICFLSYFHPNPRLRGEASESDPARSELVRNNQRRA